MAPEVVTEELAQAVPSKVCNESVHKNEVDIFEVCIYVLILHFSVNTYYPASDCRNNMFIYLHVLLEATVYAEFTYEVFGFCREMDTTLTSLSVPYVLLAVKTFFFYLCIKRDPGQFSSSLFKNICLFNLPSTLGIHSSSVCCRILES